MPAARSLPVLACLCAALAAAVPAHAEGLVATRTIRANSIIGPDDVAPRPEGGGDARLLAAAVGMEARVTLYAGREIRPGDIGPPALVDRNQRVVLRYARGGLTIETEGRALGRAAAGETVRVMNLSSRATVSGFVAADGSVLVAN